MHGDIQTEFGSCLKLKAEREAAHPLSHWAGIRKTANLLFLLEKAEKAG